MLLIGQFDSPFVRRVAVALHHYEMRFDHQPWSVWAQAEEIARYNPLRRVPVLVLASGEALVDSGAILDALDELASPERRLIAPSGAARRATLRVCALAAGLADKAVSLLYERVLRKHEAQSRTWVDRCTAQIEETLDRLDAERDALDRTDAEHGSPPREFWFGGLSHADIAVACAVRFVREAHEAVWQARPRRALATLSDRCEGLTPFRSAVQPLHVPL
jgi:glutathione S-transferase